jgi:N-methylhydantoinase B
VTNSRLPDMVALDLRAQIGAINAAKRRLMATARRAWAPTVRAVMRRSLDLAERQLRDRICRLPQGAWTGEPGWTATGLLGGLSRVTVR